MFDCSEPTTLTFSYWNIPPLVNIDQAESLRSPNNSGVMVTALEKLVHQCCHPDTKLVAGRSALNPRDLEVGVKDEAFLFPVRKSLMRLQTYYPGSELFLPVLESPGMLMMVPGSLPLGAGLLDLVVSMWRLFLIILMGCTIAGVIVWVLDHRWNPDELPKSFRKGLPEGIWWAFVTATTVGYGDIKPRFVLGRIFGVLWILTGVGLVGIFTATVTTSLNQGGLAGGTPYGIHVGVLNGSEEMHLTVAEGAHISVYNEVVNLVHSLENASEQLDDEHGTYAIMLDQFQKFQVVKELSDSNAKIVKEMDFSSMYGIVARNMSKKTVDCMGRMSESLRFEAFVQMNELRNTTKWENRISASDRFKQIVTVNPGVLLSSFAGLYLLITFIVLMEYLITKKKGSKKKGDQNGFINNCDLK